MSKHCLFVLMALLVIAETATAQNKKNIGFSSYNAAGMLAGRSPAGFSLQTVNGVYYKTWFAGVGFGIDRYGRESLPLFADMKKEFFPGKLRLFLYADVGGHFVTHRHNTASEYYRYRTAGNLYLDAGAGIKCRAGKRSWLFITAGNAYKKITQTESSVDTAWPYKNENTFSFSTISLRGGFRF